MSPLLEVEDLRVQFGTAAGVVHAVDGVSFSVDAGDTLGIVGESGSGKTATSLAILGLTQGSSAQISGRILFQGRDLLGLRAAELRSIRGNEIAMVLQDPLSSLHPFYKVGTQVVEAIVTHRRVSKSAARDRAIDLLELVGIPDPHRRVDSYPDQLSTAMRQRAMIAMAVANEPKLMLADEPAMALDVTEQAQILDLLGLLHRRLGMGIIVFTRDPAAAAMMADEICVLDAGRVVEAGSTVPAHSSSST